ncbi:ectoine utilization protein EutA [Fulvimarina sp. 2208YS6-2-32]|uniref:Ectoine utilization protein EutA n=1 Tax=Fulvimarina uroteuthidis TaxID=3098149 RepID=A0ABU5I1I2_9HYPH|nr:ectoine utilization protein EutA [Fulvimarina sp. 2208YS6-2-32]MDY8108828.1 ectoine utilization protein EutA [Fulvimarina sp. 2208YS6-2-32]
MIETIGSPGAPLRFDASDQARLGLIVLSTDLTSERDYARHLAGTGIAIFVNRIAFANPVTPENLRAMQPLLGRAAERILPGETLDAIAFSCTSASVLIGDEAVEAAIHAGGRASPVITPPRAAIGALEALGARQISMLTPYGASVGRAMAAYFERHGCLVDRLTALDIADDGAMARLSHASLVDAACRAVSPQAEALFISCTALRAVDVVDVIEQAIGRPVVTSNQAGFWAVMKACGVLEAPLAVGRLMRDLTAQGTDGKG